MKKVMFLDMACPKPYDAHTLKTESLGGTEATVIRIAEALARNNHEVSVIQHNRHTASKPEKARYTSMLELQEDKHWDAIVVLRDVRSIAFLRKIFPSTPIYLWLHDLEPAPSLLGVSKELIQYNNITLITVSKSHKTHIVETIKAYSDDGLATGFKITHIYNPVDDALQPDNTPVYEDRLLFMSSPHKGLEHVIKMFNQVVHTQPQYKLYIANPGYLKLNVESNDRIVVLGELTHDEVIRELRKAFCLFYPNPDYFTRETFGIVYAEANAVGTPCITHELGAAPEILTKEQFVDSRSIISILGKLESWRKYGRPVVTLNDKFRLSNIVKEWESLLFG